EHAGNFVYNFWQDSSHQRGIWRRTPLSEYQKSSPQWETLLDIDALASKEDENWVWKGSSCLPPEHQRCLISLSRGGKDAVVIREVHLATKEFVPQGFETPAAKTTAVWVDLDTLLIGTDWGKESLTHSGYARTNRVWKRGTPLSKAKQVF